MSYQLISIRNCTKMSTLPTLLASEGITGKVNMKKCQFRQPLTLVPFPRFHLITFTKVKTINVILQLL